MDLAGVGSLGVSVVGVGECLVDTFYLYVFATYSDSSGGLLYCNARASVRNSIATFKTINSKGASYSGTVGDTVTSLPTRKKMLIVPRNSFMLSTPVMVGGRGIAVGKLGPNVHDGVSIGKVGSLLNPNNKDGLITHGTRTTVGIRANVGNMGVVGLVISNNARTGGVNVRFTNTASGKVLSGVVNVGLRANIGVRRTGGVRVIGY